jgi:Flp pilus assembly protein TadD
MQRGAGQLQAAVLSFNEASQRNPDDAEAWLGSGVCRAALGDNVAARVDLERAAASEHVRAEPLIALADLDVTEKDLGSALRRYRAALQLDPRSVLAHLKLGNALLRTGAVALAIAQFQAAIAQQPDLAAAHNGLGAALAAQGELAKAEVELSAAARLDPADAHPWLNLARLYKRRGDTAQLSAALAHARERDPQLALAVAH